MCGRAYETYTEEELYFRYQNEKLKRNPLGFEATFNLALTQFSPVLLDEEGRQHFEYYRWGLIPFWAKDPAIGYKTINAKAETVAEKPSFREAFKRRRCIVPVSGFYEWKKAGKTKHPFNIFQREKQILSLPGLYEQWKAPNGELLKTFTIITVPANNFVQPLHDRMPAIFTSPDAEQSWLSHDTDSNHLKHLLRPCPDECLDGYEVSTSVNSPRNNDSSLLAPVCPSLQ